METLDEYVRRLEAFHNAGQGLRFAIFAVRDSGRLI